MQTLADNCAHISFHFKDELIRLGIPQQKLDNVIAAVLTKFFDCFPEPDFFTAS